MPTDVRAEFGRSEITFSLGTASRVEAERLEKEHDVAFGKRLVAARLTDKDGFSKDPEIRLTQLVRRYSAAISDDDPDPDEALAALPTAEDRMVLEKRIHEMTDKQLDDEYEIDTLLEEIRQVVFWTKNINREKFGILEVVKQNVRNLGSEFTIGWAYEKWKLIKERPEQTVTEARRYLDQFHSHSNLTLLSEIRRPHIVNWRDHLRQEGRLGPKSINHHLESRSIFSTEPHSGQVTQSDQRTSSKYA